MDRDDLIQLLPPDAQGLVDIIRNQTSYDDDIWLAQSLFINYPSFMELFDINIYLPIRLQTSDLKMIEVLGKIKRYREQSTEYILTDLLGIDYHACLDYSFPKAETIKEKIADLPQFYNFSDQEKLKMFVINLTYRYYLYLQPTEIVTQSFMDHSELFQLFHLHLDQQSAIGIHHKFDLTRYDRNPVNMAVRSRISEAYEFHDEILTDMR